MCVCSVGNPLSMNTCNQAIQNVNVGAASAVTDE